MNKKNNKSKEENYMLVGMSMGMCFGALICFLIKHISVCMCYGVSLGMLLGMGIGSAIKKDNKKKFFK